MASFNERSAFDGRPLETSYNASNQYTTLTIDPEFDLDLSGNGTQRPRLTGTIHTFRKRHNNVYGQIHHAVKPMLNIRNARRTSVLIILNILVLSFLLSWSSSSNSVALRAFTYLAVFDLLTLVTYLTSIWVSARQGGLSDNGVSLFSYERVELLMVFSSVVLSSLGAIFILKESFLRILEQPDIAIGRLIPGAFLGFFFHFVVAFSIKNKPFQSVTEASSSSIIQEHVSEISQPLCSFIPILSRILQPRIDPFFLLCTVGASLLLLTDLLIQIDLYYSADTAASVILALCTINTMWPVAACSARVLLNTTPPYVLGQLDKLLSEAQTLDGVLEIRSERFHTVALASKSHSDSRLPGGLGLILAGSISVRVRRDADEQMVLAHVTNRLSPLVTQLTVQIVKDDWTSGSVPTVGIPGKPLMGSSIIYGFNKPAAAVAPYQQTPPQKVPPPVTQVDNEIKKLSPDAAPARKLPNDDFSFSVTPVASQLKMTSYSSAGSNIARMYKAAGFTNPPQGVKRTPARGTPSSFLAK